MERDYTIFRAPGITGKVLNTGSNCAFDPVSLLDIPENPAYNCKKGRRILAGIDGRFFVKRFSHKTFFDSFRHLFKSSRPDRCLKAALKLEAAGIDTPKVFASLRKYKGLLPEFDYLITEDISQKAVFANKMPLTRQLIADLCKLLAALHKAGIIHGDTNLRNIYRTNTGFWGVIDLDGCSLSNRPVSRFSGIHELARLASSFLKLVHFRGIDGDIGGDIPGIFAQEYQKHTHFNADCPYYRRRVKYLSLRKRK